MPDERSPDVQGGGGPTRFVQRPGRIQRPVSQPPFHRWTFADGTEWTSFHRLGSGYLLRFPQLADFEVSSDGRDIRGWPAMGVKPTTVHHLYLNQVLPLALSRQGKLVLHASAVDVGGGCVAFMGASGRGKSTLAASFATAGTRFLTDDGLQLEWRGRQLIGLASHPSIRLWEDSQNALVGQTLALGPAVEYTTKARILADAGFAFCPDPQPLKAIYLLGDGTAPAVNIEPANPVTALLDLVRHSFLLDIDEQKMLASHFDDISRIANLPLHYHLDYPRRYEDLALVRQAILQHNSAVSH